ncbi:oxidoreductase, 2-nitropropane dioxygenase family [Hyphomonas neptunium ATCC 15444]|uniref:Nitronate monooxygenase n=2 Tax=Hyphomonas TaxID=85 RepID=Q0C4Y7_HYPNA|nr:MULTISPECIES: nitronate monooxygenase [Hyphomonas]ABI75838.1 oxidoreductase, 2-nitropropane dioxygenase family [Hyphomonas neptunium ATCC 15444]KCZ95639.1 2-nitropropane dioxygenase [Hyphomonas hirschiana VP5]
MDLLKRLDLSIPIIQAPMAGVSTPQLAAAISNAGGLGSIAVGATDAPGARTLIDATAALTRRPFNVNVFVHEDPARDAQREAEWLAALRPLFREFGAEPPERLETIYRSFANDDAMLALLVEKAPRVVSFHFGLPDAGRIKALKEAGCVLLSTATNLAEARAAEAAGVDAIVAQGYEAGGHRGVFDPGVPDDQIGTLALTRLLVARCALPVIAAGGIMDGAGVRAALDLGAVAAQLGTAFIACPESSADAAFRQALKSPGADHTVVTTAISGRPARCLANRFTAWGAEASAPRPAYPAAYDAGKALNAAAKAKGETGYGAQWAGQGAPLHRALPAADLLAQIADEMTRVGP